MQVIYYVGVSIDGRVAGPGDDLAYLEASTGEPDFDAFLATIDAIVLGAGTMRWLLNGGHGWPHGDVATWLVSHDEGLMKRIGGTDAPVTRHEGELGPMFAQIERARHERVWLVGGGTLAAQALEIGAIDEVVVTIVPAVLGAGPSLFEGAVGHGRDLELAACEQRDGDARITWRRRAEA